MSPWQRLFSRKRIYEELSDEIQEHLDEKADELMRSGMSREDALAAARREFGNLSHLEEQARLTWRWARLEAVLRDLRYALRQLRRNPGFTITVLLTLTLAIGLNTAVFSVISSLFLRPLPYPQPDRLAALVVHSDGIGKSGKSYSEDDDSHTGETWDLVKTNVTAAKAAVYGGSSGVNLEAQGHVRFVRQKRVSAGYFSVLGVQPTVGREFTQEEDLPQGPKAVILSHPLWQDLFGSDRGAIGRTIHLKGDVYTVVGVLPAAFESASGADLWVPLQPSRTGEGSGNNYGIILRLSDGATWAELNSQLARLQPEIIKKLLKRSPGSHSWLAAIPLQKDFAQAQATPALLLMLAVAVILLIAAANMAGLLLVRIGQRSSEISTRLALGASYGSVFRLILMEPLILSLGSGAAGTILAMNVVKASAKIIPEDLIPVNGLHLDWRVFGFTFVIAGLTALLVGIFPGLELRRMNVRSTMSAGSISVASSGSQRTRKILMSAEVALTVVLLAGSGLLIRTLVYLRTLPPGFDSTNVMSARLSLDDARYHDATAFRSLIDRSLEAMRRIPGVESAAMGLSLPFERGLNDGFRLLDGPYQGKQWASSTAYVTPDYFKVLRIPVIQGRSFRESDTDTAQHVVVLNASFAHQYFQDDAIGKHLGLGKDQCLIVGVVGDVTKAPGMFISAPLSTEPMYYVPAAQFNGNALAMVHTWFQPSWIVRTKGPVNGINASMQAALAEADPTLPFSGFYSLKDLQNRVLALQRFEVDLLSALAGLALLLSVVGIYGLVSNMVLQRTREIGIRMALGSTVRDAMLEVGKSGVIATAVGLCLGLFLAGLSLRLMQGEIYGVKSYDPLTLTGTVILLGGAALVASFAPTRRIARINPAAALRAE